ncbi:MAG: outer rane efflux protein [Cyanobacteria bacterium RYN_339]|nr:outer rane efflux protein [Cyanobacteria bacterium RYN_339]
MIGLLLAAALAGAPLTLDAALQSGLAANPELRQAELDVKRADLALQGAAGEKLTYAADLSVGDGYGASGLAGWSPLGATSIVPGSGQIPTANATLAARMPLFTGFRLERTIDQAKVGVDAAHWQLEQRRQDLIWRITQAYWQAQRAELHVAIATRARDQAGQARDVVLQSKAIGRANASEADRAEVGLLNQEAELLRAQDERLETREALARLAHQPPDAALSDPTPPANPIPAPAEATQRAEASRPDLLLLEANARATGFAWEASQADRWPQVALEGAYQHGNNPFDPVAQSRLVLSSLSGNAYARVNLSYRLFDNGAIARTIEARRLERDQALEAGRVLREQVQADVRQALARVASARKRVALGERSVALARKNQTYLENRFKFGYALLTELNEARVNLVTSENQRADAAIRRARRWTRGP